LSCVDDLVRLIERATGNVIPGRDHRFLEAIARKRMVASGASSLECFVRDLQAAEGSEWRALLNQVTVKESYLFRGRQQFDAIATRVIPSLMARREQPRLRLWSSGCARGEEPVTLALILMEIPELAGWDWQILATDVDENALDDARRGRFGARAMARVPDHLVAKYFVPDGGATHRLRPEAQDRIEYRQVNLIADPMPGDGEAFDVILLRNVLIYFRPESQRRVVAGVTQRLAQDGTLFVGPSETLWGLHPELQAIDLECCFAYGRAAAAVDLEVNVAPIRGTETSAPRPAAHPERALDTSVGGTRTALAAGVASGGLGPGQRTRDRCLVLAVEALFAGAPARARAIVVEGLRERSDDPVLHAMEGLAAEALADHAGAIRACRGALYLEPRLYQIRLVLARNLARVGWRRRSIQEYERTLEDLQLDGSIDLERGQEIGLPRRDQARELCHAALAELRLEWDASVAGRSPG
jgi:chemotaxis protein methyltransferase CheR